MIDEELIDEIFGTLGICSCGDTDGQLNFIKEYLNIFVEPKYMDTRALELIKNNSESVYEILGHFLAERDIVEYGSSIRGCWLTGEGENLLKKLNSIESENKHSV